MTYEQRATLARDSIAWAAGLFEGEGCFFLNHGRTFRCQLRMTDEDIVRRFHGAVGVGTVYGPHHRKAPWKPSWTWQAHGSQAVAVFDLLKPYLGVRRRARALELLGHDAPRLFDLRDVA